MCTSLFLEKLNVIPRYSWTLPLVILTSPNSPYILFAHLPNSSLTKSNVTDANGKVQFTYELEAILNVEATKTILPNTYTGKNIIRLLKGKTVEKTIEIN